MGSAVQIFWKEQESSPIESLTSVAEYVVHLINHNVEALLFLFSFEVTSRTSDSDAPSGATEVSVKLFDSDPITVSVPEEVSRNNPQFIETVAEKALQEYRKKNREE
ncbi:PREDICTED: clusterin-like [Propithecus coquereli]|uniref:clusterin-like n=1 Tax=Propithecus coquereli TaxID=379532 RepID=UPI00063F09E7|nr:PREDICTED: clusterin-like [Propithecus coquereli]